MIQINHLQKLLTDTGNLLEKHHQSEKKKGEKFNVFSVLKMETQETKTHSAFLGELLDYKGSHGMGRIFLELFLERIEKDTLKSKRLDPSSTSVQLELSIGNVFIDKDNPMNSRGGRIDIYLKDGKGNSASVENKINAGEQELQIVRYHNHNKNNNTVYYLTLNGEPPQSHLNLQSGKDFIEINYARDMIQWLEDCHEKCREAEKPILGSSIYQYIQLIKKLTYQVEEKDKKEFYDIINENFEAAQFIKIHAENARQSISEEIRKAVFEQLKTGLDPDKYLISEGASAYETYSQIWVFIKDFGLNHPLHFGIESFSGNGHKDGQLYMGINYWDSTGSKKSNPLSNVGYQVDLWGHWARLIDVRNFKGIPVNFKHPKTITALHRNQNNFKEEFIKHIVSEFTEYIENQYRGLYQFLDNNYSKK